MKPFEIASQFQSPLRAKETMDFLTSTEALILFDGYGLVPGIYKAEEMGQERVFTSPRGRQRRERILVRNNQTLWMEIYPAWPEKMFYRSISERFQVTDNSQGSTVERRMILSCRTGASLPGRWGSEMLNRAIAANNKKLKEALSGRVQSDSWL